jgi:thiol-disulfide isomerase/thioredoxin
MPPSRSLARGALLVALQLLILAPGAGALGEGDPAPQFRAPALVGDGAVSLAEQRGKVVYLDFWASWCGPCATSLPLLDALRKEFAPGDFTVVAVNVDRDPDAARRFLERRPVGYPSASDPQGAIPPRFGVETMPTAYLIDRSGVIRHVHRGFRRGDLPALRERIAALVADGR